MNITTKDIFLIVLITLTLTIIVWLPHLLALPNFWGLNFSNGFSTIYRNFDGLEYIIIAKTWYSSSLISALPQTLPANYFASHFPGYSILIALFAPILGFLKSMLFVSVLSTILATWVFYILVSNFKLSKHPLFLSFIFLILPARWLIVRNVGSAEPLFILFTLLTFYFFMKFEITNEQVLSFGKRVSSGNKLNFILLSGFFGFLAQITRPPGILLFLALCAYILWKKRGITSYYPLLLIPLGLLLVFSYFGSIYNDFFAYFHSGDNIHLTLPPFQSLNKNQFWVGDIWLEDIIYIFVLGFLAGVMLLKQRLYAFAFFVLTYLVASVFVAHRDISRYTLPIIPFVIIAFEKLLVSKEFKIVLIIVALAIYLYTQNFIIENAAPIPNLEAFD